MNDKDFKNCIFNAFNDMYSSRYLIELLKYCSPLEQSVSDNLRKDDFAIGVKSVGQKILDDILLYCPEKYLEITKKMKGLD